MNMHTAIISSNVQTTRETWSATLVELERAKRAFHRYDTTVFEPMYRYIEATAPRPDLHFEIIARSGQSARFMVSLSDLHGWDDHISPEFREKAAAIREAWLAHRSLCGLMGWDEVCEEQERLCGVQCDLEENLILMPAPNSTALYWKLDRLFGPNVRADDDFGAAWCANWLNIVMADARRFLA